MQVNEQNTLWAMEKLYKLACLPGYPKEAIHIEAYAEAFLRIVHNKTPREIWDAIRPGIEHPGLAKFPCGEHENDVDWIIRTILERCETVPMPVTIRRMYGRYISPSVKSVVDDEIQD